jgi:cell wall-associated NlpC family hydrolase
VRTRAARCLHPEPLLESAPCDGRPAPVQSVRDPDRGVGIRPGKKLGLLFLLCLAAVLLLAGSATSQPSIDSKQAEADQILAQIQQIDADLGLAVEAYNAAEIKLDGIRAEQRVNERRLKIARANFSRAQATLDARLITLYTEGEADVLEVLLGSASLDELLDRLDTANRVSEEDAKIVEEVRTFRAEIKRREKALAQARVRQEAVVAERAARRASIQSKLAERKRLLSSVRSEIARLQAAERARQRELEAQARARISAPSSGGEATFNAPAAQYGGVVGIAMQYLGIPYQWGGASPSTGFDCSGFIMYVYGQVGVSLPHNAAMQYQYGSPVSRSQLAPGDLVFFNGLGHAGIYIGGNQFIHSPHTGDVVKISGLTGWYSDTYYGARRL